MFLWRMSAIIIMIQKMDVAQGWWLEYGKHAPLSDLEAFHRDLLFFVKDEASRPQRKRVRSTIASVEKEIFWKKAVFFCDSCQQSCTGTNLHSKAWSCRIVPEIDNNNSKIDVLSCCTVNLQIDIPEIPTFDSKLRRYDGGKFTHKQQRIQNWRLARFRNTVNPLRGSTLITEIENSLLGKAFVDLVCAIRSFSF